MEISGRKEIRLDASQLLALIRCQLVTSEMRFDLEVINFHSRGACLKLLSPTSISALQDQTLLFSIGLKDLNKHVKYRLVWETITENGLFGVEFLPDSALMISRAQRFLMNEINAPVIAAIDPLDPNRALYLRVINASPGGLGLVTSLSNKHLLPGMELRSAQIEIAGLGRASVDLFIENASMAAGRLQLGVSLREESRDYSQLLAKYLSNLGQATDQDDRIENLSQAGYLRRELKQHLTVVEVRDREQYDKVLKLRFQGYDAVGKVSAGKTWKDMGEGLEFEGVVLAAILGGQIVASAEIRIHHIHGVRLAAKFDLKTIKELKSERLVEVNKLVVHTRAQGTDIVVGMFQKIHAIGMINNAADFICASEPKLMPLYERIGFQKTEFTYPHPVKLDMPLTLMVLPRRVHGDAKDMNPFAWEKIYGSNLDYFDALGLYQKPKFSAAQRLVSRSTAISLRISAKLKNHRKNDRQATSQVPTLNKATLSSVVPDPRWTKMHLNATVMWPYILQSKILIGEKETLAILYEFRLTVDYFQTVSNWISIEFFDEFIERFSKLGDPYILNRQAGLLNVSPQILGSNYYLVKHCLTPRLVIKTLESSVLKFNKTRRLKVLESGRDFSRIRITNPDRDLLPKHPSAKENWYAVFEGVVQVITDKPARIEKIKSAFDGDEYCEFVVHWDNSALVKRSLVALILLAVFTTSILVGMLNHFQTAASWSVIACVLTALIATIFGFRAHSAKRKYREVVESLREYEKHADARYTELQNSKAILEKSVQEGKILEDIHREIQRSNDLSNLLQTALEALSEKFAFRRAFAMIHDSSNQTLRTSAVTGMGDAATEVWNFVVDVSKPRDNGLVLSSAFLSGQSILISDVNAHISHLTDGSRKLVERLKTNGFAIVPIPSHGQNWGVICADKGESCEPISRRDLVALQRISQSLGLALDKQSKIASEIRARKIFQKFVPSTVVESTLGETGPTLGGQSKDVVCLFLDIRDFTALSNRLPSEILVDLLNQIFEVVQRNVSACGGIIDKFIGDGVLVHWGAIPGSDANSTEAIHAAQRILIDLEILNQSFLLRGLSAIEVGIGIHRGRVIAGNIGSQERMEFTIVGSEVNFASRLEGLNKIYQSNIVISQNLVPFEKLGPEWSIFTAVKIRGVDNLVSVAAFTSNRAKVVAISNSVQPSLQQSEEVA